MNTDLELERLFQGSPELAATAQRLRECRPEPVLDPAFPSRLRTQLLVQASQRLRPRSARSWWQRPAGLAWSSAATAAAAALVTTLALGLGGGHHTQHVEVVTVTSPLTGQPAVTADVITVAFSQPMDHDAVLSGLSIRPATAVHTSWQGNDLLISPLHRLSPNTPYTVSIDEGSARSLSGGRVPGGVRIAFGTAPRPRSLPIPAVPTPPLLDPRSLVPVATPGGLTFGPSGDLLVPQALPAPRSDQHPVGPTTAASPSATASPAAGTTPAAEATASASPAAAPTPEAGASAASSPTPALMSFSPDGHGHLLGQGALAVSPAPDGRRVVAAVPRGGGADILIHSTDSAGPAMVGHSDAPVSQLAWSGGDHVIYLAGGAVRSMAVADGSQQLILPLPSQVPVRLAPGGAYAFVGGGGAASPGTLVNLGTRAARPLRGSQATVAFSPDGRTVAWLASGSFELSPVDRDELTSIPVPPDHAGHLDQLAVSGDLRRLAYVSTETGSGGPTTVVLQVASGRILASAPGASHPALSPAGDRLAVDLPQRSASGLVAAVAALPAAPPPLPGSAMPLPSRAGAILDRLVDAQVRGDPSALIDLGGGERSIAELTPSGLSRGNIIMTTTHASGRVVALVELIVDPSGSRPEAFADESVTLDRSGPQDYAIRSVDIGSLRDRAPGPRITEVSAAGSNAGTILVSFDSDLSPASVSRAISLRTLEGAPVPSTVSYSSDSRTAVVSPAAPGTSSLQLVVSTALRDISGQTLATPFVAPLRG